MGKLIKCLFLSVVLMQIAAISSTPTSFNDNDQAVLNVKRHNLLKRTFVDLRKAIWQDGTFDFVTELLKDLRQWSNTVEDKELNKSEFVAQIDACLNLVNTLKADRTNCDVHRNLLEHYIKIRELVPKDNAKFQDMNNVFKTKLVNVLMKQREHLYAMLNEEVQTFIRDLSETEKQHTQDIIQWHEKFNKEKDTDIKEHIAIHFPELFSKKLLDASTTCMPKIS